MYRLTTAERAQRLRSQICTTTDLGGLETGALDDDDEILLLLRAVLRLQLLRLGRLNRLLAHRRSLLCLCLRNYNNKLYHVRRPSSDDDGSGRVYRSAPLGTINIGSVAL